MIRFRNMNTVNRPQVIKLKNICLKTKKKILNNKMNSLFIVFFVVIAIYCVHLSIRVDNEGICTIALITGHENHFQKN